MASALYLYAVGRAGEIAPPSVTGVDGSTEYAVVAGSGLAALASRVDPGEFGQEAVDARAGDLEWLGGIGYRHQDVVSAVRDRCDAIPLRAFTLFSGERAVEQFLAEERERLTGVLDAIRGRDEWTVRLEFDDERWAHAVEGRSPALAALAEEAKSAPAGRAYLLRRKMDEARKTAARDAEQQLVAEVETRIGSALAAPTLAEGRLARGGSFPQINVLVEKSRREQLEVLHRDLRERYRPEGIELALTGPWPPYSFVSRSGS